ncbi:MAG: hypothetical protein NZ561_07525, partial [Phycisphaerae bacterium]|nr:hypothetical protein [Phycisphaerae bacterium]
MTHRTRALICCFAHVPALMLGVAVNLVVNGYQFGLSNHSVYLIDALRRSEPALLANDWFYTQTFQYHSVFGWLTALLLQAGILEPAFALIYAGLLVGLHGSWRALVGMLGGGDREYLLSVVLYFLSAGGIGLGTYQFLQDSCVLASNVANVAMFAGVVAWIGNRRLLGAVLLAMSGIFHLNHAVVVLFIYFAMAVYDNRRQPLRWLQPAFLAATAIICMAAAANLAPAVQAKLSRPGGMPLSEFVDLYVKLRHPHHYDPASWPFALWLAFCIWLPPAGAWMLLTRRGIRPLRSDDPSADPAVEPAPGVDSSAPTCDPSAEARQRCRDRAVVVPGLFLFLQVVALLFAGFWYVSETLIQMSLFRFSIMAHVMMVLFASLLLSRWKPIGYVLPALMALALLLALLSPMEQTARQRAGPIAALILLGFCPLAAPLLRGHPKVSAAIGTLVLAALLISPNYLTGLTRPLVQVDADYRALCRWVRDNTPVDAVFLTPPTDED